MDDTHTLAEVTYRADRADGAVASLRLRMPGGAATAADGWARLTAVFGPVDPRSIEIEVREADFCRSDLAARRTGSRTLRSAPGL